MPCQERGDEDTEQKDGNRQHKQKIRIQADKTIDGEE
jgi:hypothetical protein